MGLKKIIFITMSALCIIGALMFILSRDEKIDEDLLKISLSIADEQIGAYSGKQSFDVDTLDESKFDKSKILLNLETSVKNLKKMDGVVVDVGDFYNTYYKPEVNNNEYDSLNLDFDPDEGKGEYYEEEPDFDKRIVRGEDRDVMRVTDFNFSGTNFTDIVRYKGVNMVFEGRDVPPTYLSYISNPDNLYTFSSYRIDDNLNTIDVSYVSITGSQALTVKFKVEGDVITDYEVY